MRTHICFGLERTDFPHFWGLRFCITYRLKVLDSCENYASTFKIGSHLKRHLALTIGLTLLILEISILELKCTWL